MKVILRKDVKGLGKSGDVVNVKDGYARNYLIPNGLAYRFTEGYKKQVENEIKQNNKKLERKREEFKKLAKQLETVSLTITKKAGEEDKLFGSVTSADISEALKKEGFSIDKKYIVLTEPIKKLGTYDVKIHFFEDIETTIKVWVVSE